MFCHLPVHSMQHQVGIHLPPLAHRQHSRYPTRTEQNDIRSAMNVARVLNPEPVLRTPLSTASNGSKRQPSPKATGPRPKYTFEQGLAIWYMRTDLSLEWDVIEERFMKWFQQQPREKDGLRCKFYR